MPDHVVSKQQAPQLTDDVWNLLLRQWSPDPEIAGQHYEALRSKLIFYFQRYNCADPATLADQTLDRVAQRLASGVVLEQTIAHFAFGVARNLLHESTRQTKFVPLPDDEVLQKKLNGKMLDVQKKKEAEEAHERLLECLRICLARLTEAERTLLQTYYHDQWSKQVEQRKSLMQTLGLTYGSVRARAYRLRQDVRRCVERCQNSPLKK